MDRGDTPPELSGDDDLSIGDVRLLFTFLGYFFFNLPLAAPLADANYAPTAIHTQHRFAGHNDGRGGDDHFGGHTDNSEDEEMLASPGGAERTDNDDDDDDDLNESGMTDMPVRKLEVHMEGAYDPADYANLPVSADIKELFNYIGRLGSRGRVCAGFYFHYYFYGIASPTSPTPPKRLMCLPCNQIKLQAGRASPGHAPAPVYPRLHSRRR
jgi:hypothetical protein